MRYVFAMLFLSGCLNLPQLPELADGGEVAPDSALGDDVAPVTDAQNTQDATSDAAPNPDDGVDVTEHWVQVGAGRDFACALTNIGRVFCWGRGADGQLGEPDGLGSSTPVPIDALPPISEIAVGGAFACALTTERKLWCWGANLRGQIPGAAEEAEPTEVFTDEHFTAVEAGASHVCAKPQGGENLLCWGYNASGQTGSIVADPSIGDTVTFSRSGFWSAGARTTCVFGKRAGEQDRLYCFGTTALMAEVTCSCAEGTRCGCPEDMMFPDDLEMVSVGDGHACYGIGRTVSCWGTNAQSCSSSSVCISGSCNGNICNSAPPVEKLGVDGVAFPPQPVQVESHADQGALVDLSAGRNHTCFADNLGQVFCWGWNLQGELSVASADSTHAPQQIPVVSDIVQVSAGDGFTCARDSRDIWCWGDNGAGKLGTDNNTDPFARLPEKIAAPAEL